MFSEIDLWLGYWQMPVKLEDVHKTVFNMRRGLYEFLVMPFGVTNGPTQFKNMMNDLLDEYLDKFILVFLDNILIYSANHRTMLITSRKYLQSSGSISCLQRPINVKL